MDIIIALVFFGVGLGLIIFFAEQLVKGVVGTSMGFGLSAFLLSVIFIGFDPDNLAVGTVASAEGVTGIALGSILGGAMVAIARAISPANGPPWAYLSCRSSPSWWGASCWSAVRRPS